MGTSTNVVPDDCKVAIHLKKSKRYQIIQQVTADFWFRWSQEVTLEAIIRQQWHENGRNLQVGDIVLVHDQSPLKGKYILGMVESVKQSEDNLVRSCVVGYSIPNSRDPIGKSSGSRKVSVSRSF